jgi:hypothetical protein
MIVGLFPLIIAMFAVVVLHHGDWTQPARTL